MRHALAGLVAAAALLAGCATGAGSFHASASRPLVMASPGTPAYGYDGTGMVEATGTLDVTARDAANTGAVRLDLDVPSGPSKGHYVVDWTDFHIQPNQAWQDGGIACGPGLVEHGASGHGNKMEPQFGLECGGWGTANATRDGQPLSDPVTGATSFNAHFMVTKQAMLQSGGKVLKADRTTPFDPHDPGDGYVDPSRTEAHFALWGSGVYKDGIALPPPPPRATFLNGTATGAVPPAPTYREDAVVAVASTHAAIHLHLDLGAATDGGPGLVSLTLLDPAGQPVDGFTVNSAMRSRDLDVTKALPAAGNYTMRVDAQGIQTPYQAAVTVQEPTPFLLHAVFRDVRLG